MPKNTSLRSIIINTKKPLKSFFQILQIEKYAFLNKRDRNKNCRKLQ